MKNYFYSVTCVDFGNLIAVVIQVLNPSVRIMLRTYIDQKVSKSIKQ